MKHKFFASLLTITLISAVSCGKNVPRTEKISAPETSSDTAVTTSAPTVSTTAVTTTSKKVESATTQPPAELLELTGAEAVPVYEEMTVNGFLTSSNVIILNGDQLLDTSETGTKTVTIKYSQGGTDHEKELSYIVEDTEPPVLLNSGSYSYHQAGKDFDLNNYVGFADNYDRSPSLTYDGYIDPDTIGDYPITAYAEDSSGNVTSWDLTISVVSSVPKPPDDRTRVSFSDFTSIYGGDGRQTGIDVSTWQGDIDWEAVRDAGCSFALMRMGYSYGNIVMDDKFYANIDGARNAGIPLSIYFYTTANCKEDILEQTRWIAENLDGAAMDLPVAFDWEEFGNFQKYGMNIKDINDLYSLFVDEMAGYGYETMLYSSKNFLRNVWNEHSKSITPVWLAHYVDDTDYDGEFIMWQQSSCGRIPGIAGDVDMNILYQ